LHCAIGAAGGQGFAVRAERHRHKGQRNKRHRAAGDLASELVAGGHIPQHCAIGTAGGQGLAVRAERHRRNRARAGGDRAHRLRARERAHDRPVRGHIIPQQYRPVSAASGQGFAVRAEHRRPNRARVDGEAPDLPVSGHIPQPHRAIGAGQGLAVRAERHRCNRAGAGGERAPDLPVSGHIPQPYRPVSAASGQDPAVRAEPHRVDPPNDDIQCGNSWPCSSRQHGITSGI